MWIHPFFFFPFGGFFLFFFLFFFFRRFWWGGRAWGLYGGYHYGKSPEDILGERFANGEIGENEFRERLSPLQDSRKKR